MSLYDLVTEGLRATMHLRLPADRWYSAAVAWAVSRIEDHR